MFEKLSHAVLIKPAERSSVFYFVLLFFLIGCGMAIGRGSANALFFARYGIEHLPLVYLIQGGLQFVFTVVYAAYADRIAPEKLLQPLMMLVAVLVIGFWLSMTFFSIELVYPAYYLLYEIVSEIVLVQCTLYLARNFDVLQAKRLTPLILAGWQLGAIIGGVLLATVVAGIGAQSTLLIWVILLVFSMMLLLAYHQKTGGSPLHRAGRKGGAPLEQAMEQLSQAFTFARQSALLKAMSLALFFMVITFYVLCYSVNRVYAQSFQDEAQLTAFFGWLGAVTGLFALLVQVFITNRLVRRYGVRKMNLVFPGLTLLAYLVLMINYSLPAALLASVVKDAVLPAIRNPVKAMFFNALPGFIQGRSHALMVGLVLPLALCVAGASLMLAQMIEQVVYFLVIGLLTAVVYYYYSVVMNRGYVDSIINSLRRKLFVPDEQTATITMTPGGEQEIFDELVQACANRDEDIRFASAKSLIELFPDKAGPKVLVMLDDFSAAQRDRLFHLLAPLEPPEFHQYLRGALQQDDCHLRASALYLLCRQKDAKAKQLLEQLLKDTNPRLQAIAIYGVLHYPVDSLKQQALTQWQSLLASHNSTCVLSALDLLRLWPRQVLAHDVIKLLAREDSRILTSALEVLQRGEQQSVAGLDEYLLKLSSHKEPGVRVLATRCLPSLAVPVRRELVCKALNDDHPEVRDAAATIMVNADSEREMAPQWLLAEKASPRAQLAVLGRLQALEDNAANKRAFMQQLANRKAEQAYQLLLFQQQLQRIYTQSSVNINLLLLVLEERSYQYLDMALQAARSFEDAATIGVIQAGIKSADKRHWSATCEAARYLMDQRLASLLVACLEHLLGEPRKHNNLGVEVPADRDSIFKLLSQRRDPWLQTCVRGFQGVV